MQSDRMAPKTDKTSVTDINHRHVAISLNFPIC